MAGGDENAAEAARLDFTKLILYRHFDELTLEKLDEQVRQAVLD